MSIKSPISIMFNASGSELAIVKDAPLTGNQPTVPIAGSDGSFIRLLKTTGDGTLFITGSVGITNVVPVAVQGQVSVDNFPTTQRVSGSVSVFTEGPQNVTGSVAVYTQGPQAVSGTVFVTTTGSFPVTVQGVPQVTGSVAITNNVPVTVTNPTQTYDTGVQAVSGSVSVYTQGPQAVTGSVATYTQGPQLVSGTISVTGSVPVYTTSPQSVTGSVAVYTQGAQQVSGSVSVYTQGPQNVTGSVNVYTQGPQAVTGSQLSGSTFAGSPVVVGGVDSSAIVRTVLTDAFGAQFVTSSFVKPLFAYPTSERITIMSGATLTTSGNVLVDMWPAWTEWYLIVNLSGTVGGTSPGIQFYVDQVDPIDKVTQVEPRTSGTMMTARGVDNFQVVDTSSDTFRIGWVVSGSNPVFSGVNVSWVGRAAGSAIEGQAAVGTVADDPPVQVAGVDDSNTIQYLRVDSAGNLHVIPQAVATTTTASLSPGWVRYGGSSGVQTAVRATTYTEQTGSSGRSLKSTSANDSASGTGAQQVQITYYDTNGNGPFTETVTLNGLTAVNTVSTTMRYIEKMVVTRVGSGGSNVGTISLFTATGGTGGVIGSIAVGTTVAGLGDNQTLWAHHYVGNLLTGSVVGMTCGTNGNQTAVAYLRVQNLTTGSIPETFLTDVLTVAQAADSVIRTYPAGVPVMGPARVTMYVVSNGTNTNFYGSFDWQEHY